MASLTALDYFDMMSKISKNGKSASLVVGTSIKLTGGGAEPRSVSRIIAQAKDEVKKYLNEMICYVGTKEFRTLEGGDVVVINAIRNVGSIQANQTIRLRELSIVNKNEKAQGKKAESSETPEKKVFENSEKKMILETLKKGLNTSVIAFLAAKGTFVPSRQWVLVDDGNETAVGVWVCFPAATEDNARGHFQTAFANSIARALDLGVQGGILSYMIKSKIPVDPSMRRFCFAKGNCVEGFDKMDGDNRKNAQEFRRIMGMIIDSMGKKNDKIDNGENITFFNYVCADYEKYKAKKMYMRKGVRKDRKKINGKWQDVDVETDVETETEPVDDDTENEKSGEEEAGEEA